MIVSTNKSMGRPPMGHPRCQPDTRELQTVLLASMNLDQDFAATAAYANTGARPGAVGYDEQNRLVERLPDGSLKPLDAPL